MIKNFILFFILFIGLSAFAEANCVITNMLSGNNVQYCNTISGNKKCKIVRIGDEYIDYRFDGIIKSIGNRSVLYQDGKIVRIGDEYINYRFDGIIKSIGNRSVLYQTF